MIVPLPRYSLFPYTTLFRSRRAAREPVPCGPDADGAGGQRTDVHLRHHESYAPRLDQCEAGLGGREGVLRVVAALRSEEHTSELQSLRHLVCRLLFEKKKID